jgi:hypothetical protein
LEKQAAGDSMARLKGDAESVGKWGVYWGVANGKTWVLFGPVGKVVG